MIVPNLAELGAAVVERALAGGGLVVARALAAEERQVAKLLGQDALDVGKGVARGVGRTDAGVAEPAPRGKLAEVVDDGLEELKEVGVLGRLGAPALGLESRVASGVLGVLMTPELPVAVKLANPELVHVGKQIFLAVRREPLIDGFTLVRRDRRAIGLAVGRVRGRTGIVLAAQVAVLRVRAVAEVGPEAMDTPGVLRQKLAFVLAACEDAPKLSLQLEFR